MGVFEISFFVEGNEAEDWTACWVQTVEGDDGAAACLLVKLLTLLSLVEVWVSYLSLHVSLNFH